MSFHINTDKFMFFTSYDDVAQYFENTCEVRGYVKKDNGVPLRRDRKNPHQMRVMQKINYSDQTQPPAYAARMYSTDCVTWYADGRVVINAGGWSTQSTAAFIGGVLSGVYTSIKGGHVVLGVAGGEVVCHDYVTLRRVASANGIMGWQADPATCPVVGVVRTDRKIGGVARRALKESGWTDYLKAMRSVVGANEVAADTLEAMREEGGHAAKLARYARYWRFGSGARLDYDRAEKKELRTAYNEAGAYYIEPCEFGRIPKGAFVLCRPDGVVPTYNADGTLPAIAHDRGMMTTRLN